MVLRVRSIRIYIPCSPGLLLCCGAIACHWLLLRVLVLRSTHRLPVLTVAGRLSVLLRVLMQLQVWLQICVLRISVWSVRLVCMLLLLLLLGMSVLLALLIRLLVGVLVLLLSMQLLRLRKVCRLLLVVLLILLLCVWRMALNT